MRFKRAGLGLTAVAAAVAASVALAGAQPQQTPIVDSLAMIIQASHGVHVVRGKTAPQAAGAGMRLLAGDQLVVPSGDRAMLLYRSGKMEWILSNLALTSAGSAGKPGRVFTRSVSTVATAGKGRAASGQGVIRPIGGSAAPIEPRNQIVLLDTRPTFSWFRVPDATGYSVQIRRADGKPVRYDVGRDSIWRLPASEPPLMAGETYEWTVIPQGSGRIASPQTFRVISPAQYTELTRRLKEIEAAGADPGGDGLFLSALVYHELGLEYEAARALDRLAGTDAGRGEPFHRLRADVYGALGDLAAQQRELQEAGQSATQN